MLSLCIRTVYTLLVSRCGPSAFGMMSPPVEQLSWGEQCHMPHPTSKGRFHLWTSVYNLDLSCDSLLLLFPRVLKLFYLLSLALVTALGVPLRNWFRLGFVLWNESIHCKSQHSFLPIVPLLFFLLLTKLSWAQLKNQRLPCYSHP